MSMTTPNTPDQRIDDILNCTDFKGSQLMVAKYYSDRGEFGWTPLADVLKSLFETMCNEIFGESQSDPEIYFGNGEEILRQRIPQVISKYFGENE